MSEKRRFRNFLRAWPAGSGARLCGLVAAVVMMASSANAAAWEFDDAVCAPQMPYETETLPPPQTMLMVDRSGSMDGSIYTTELCHVCTYNIASKSDTTSTSCDHCRSSQDCAEYADLKWSNRSLTDAEYSAYVCGTTIKTLWEIAKDSIDALVADKTGPDPDDVRFGLGLFSGYRASIRLDAKEDAHDDIMDILNSAWPSGVTPTEDAIDKMRRSNTVRDAPGGSGGILLTDGKPTSDHDDTIEAACEHREVAPLYVVGFGGGTDEAYNNALAAAGGTGSCLYGGDPCARGWYQYNANYWDDRCTGSVQADNEIELQDALNSVAKQISCTFDVTELAENADSPIWDENRQGCDNYDCLRVRLNGSVGSRIYHMDSSQQKRGWEWSSSEHTQIRLLNSDEGASDDYCQKLRSGELIDSAQPDIEVTRACMCVQDTGNACGNSAMVPPPSDCQCPVGTWSCQQGNDICEPNDSNNCEEALVGEGEACDNGLLGICFQEGLTVCEGDQPVCDAPEVEPQEEVCDGLDNDCGGLVDEAEGIQDDAAPGSLVRQAVLCHVDYADSPGDAEDAAISEETTRCNIGMRACHGGSYTCEALDPMPEVCNGIDDDCDDRGMIDNLSTSWDHEEFSDYSLDGDVAPAACYERSVCSCPDGRDTFEGDDFDTFVEGWANRDHSSEPIDPTCVCGEGIVE